MPCANPRRAPLALAPRVLAPFYFCTGALSDQKLADSSRLACQGAPRNHLTLPPQCWDCKHASPHPEFFRYNIVFTLRECHTCERSVSIIVTPHTPNSKSSLCSQSATPLPMSFLLPNFRFSLLFAYNSRSPFNDGNIHVAHLAFLTWVLEIELRASSL